MLIYLRFIYYFNRSRIELVHQFKLTRIAQGNEATHQKEAYGCDENIYR